jgi:hypothetical protein
MILREKGVEIEKIVVSPIVSNSKSVQGKRKNILSPLIFLCISPPSVFDQSPSLTRAMTMFVPGLNKAAWWLSRPCDYVTLYSPMEL